MVSLDPELKAARATTITDHARDDWVFFFSPRLWQGDEEGGADLVEEYTRSFKGRVALSGSSSAVGAALGAMISKVLVGFLSLPTHETLET